MNAVDSILGIREPQTDAQRRTYAARVAKARKLLLRKSPSGSKPKHVQRATVGAEVKALGQVTTVLIGLPLASRERVLTLARTYILGQP